LRVLSQSDPNKVVAEGSVIYVKEDTSKAELYTFHGALPKEGDIVEFDEKIWQMDYRK